MATFRYSQPSIGPLASAGPAPPAATPEPTEPPSSQLSLAYLKDARIEVDGVAGLPDDAGADEQDDEQEGRRHRERGRRSR